MKAIEIREISRASNVCIASHGYYHNNLGSIKLNDAKWELKQSKDYLEKVTEQSIDMLAYPDGSYNKDLLQAARNMGYSRQLLADMTDEDNPYPTSEDVFHRMTIHPYISPYNLVLAIIKGTYN